MNSWNDKKELVENLKFVNSRKSSYSNISPMQVDITDDTVNMAADNDTVTGSTQHIHNSDQSGQSTPTHRRTSQVGISWIKKENMNNHVVKKNWSAHSKNTPIFK